MLSTCSLWKVIADMTNQILEVLEQRPLDVPQCKAAQPQPSLLPTTMPAYETATLLRLQYDVPVDSNDQTASGMHRSSAVSSPLRHTDAA